MSRFLTLMTMAVVVLANVAEAQQATQRATRQAPPRPTRSYRSYSVTPAPRGDVSPGSRHATEATWRHAGAKPVGHYGSGR
jgi:hypothetical protein